MQTIEPIDPTEPGDAANIIDLIKVQTGGIPNVFATMARSPIVLEGYLAFGGALQSGIIGSPLCEQIALAIAGQNGCDYSASVHAVLARNNGIDEDEIRNNLTGFASEGRTAVLIDFVVKVVRNRGRVSESDVVLLQGAGVTEQELVELIAHIGINIFTNYFNQIARTEIDFPLVKAVA